MSSQTDGSLGDMGEQTIINDAPLFDLDVFNLL